MGIKGIYGQTGPGQRIALSKVAVEHYEKNSRPFRLAIDISIWNFQTQSGRGGHNPVLRTLYYRLLRLLSLAIRPLFVFDGPNKPPFKRNKKTGYNSASLPDYLTKQLLKQFGFPFHTAPGEAEAECALLQQSGVVDAVLSEDVDTLMFGCSVTLRNWSKEGTKGNKAPTHVNVYRAEATLEASGLDRDGMILVALMSGGDYVPEGIPGCGVKTACEAARAGFGKDLRSLSKNDTAGYREWRDWLEHELHTNEGGYFRTKHGALVIPEDFPRNEVLRYYTDPVVSSPEKIVRLSQNIPWETSINVAELRTFVAEAFEWVDLSGAKKFIRGLAPSLLVDQLRRGPDGCNRVDAVNGKEPEEGKLIKAICERRNHFIVDGLPELRLAYVPAEICGLNLEMEEVDNEQGQINTDSEAEHAEGSEERGAMPLSPRKIRAPSPYDPTQLDKIWLLETWAKVGAPLLVESWEEEQRGPRSFATRKARERKQITNGGMKHGALDSYVKVTKSGVQQSSIEKSTLATISRSESSQTTSTPTTKSNSSITGHRKASLKSCASPRQKDTESLKGILTNPWTLSKRPSDTFSAVLPSGTRYSALGIYVSDTRDDAIIAKQNTSDEENQPQVATRLRFSSNAFNKRTTPLANSSLDDNVTVRRKRKAKPLTKVLSAPCGTHEIIDLDSPGGSEAEYSMRPPVDGPSDFPHKPTSKHWSSPSSRTLQGIPTLTPEASRADHENVVFHEASRKINFRQATSPPPTSPTSSDLLPSPSALISGSVVKSSEVQQHEPRPLNVAQSPTAISKKKAKLVTLRDSLEGAWRDTNSSEKARPGRTYSSVSMVDLTSD